MRWLDPAFLHSGVSGKTSAFGSGGWLNITDKFYKAKS